jgi:hypothetical protein
MKKILPVFILSAFSLIFPFPGSLLWGQEGRALIKINPFTAADLGNDEGALIESLVRSYLADFGEVASPYEALAGNSPWGSPETAERPPDYILSGNLYLEQGSRVFTLEIHKTATGETSSYTSIHRTTSELALKARSLVEALFVPAENESMRISPAETITEQGISGTWRGEPGIEMILIYPGGRGRMIFSSGAQMALVYSVRDNILLVRQDSPNTERFYHHFALSPEQSRQLAASAEPLRWEMLLRERGAVLRGAKLFTKVELAEETVEVEWSRTR